MGKRTSQGAPPRQPTVRKRQRTLLGWFVRVASIVVIVGALLFLLAGWYYSGEIEQGALKPPTNAPPDYPWNVVDIASTISLTAPAGTDQAGQAGLSGIRWESDDGHSGALLSSNVDGGTATDVRVLEQGPVPSIGESVQVDPYYWRGDPTSTFDLPFETVYYQSDVGSFPAWYIDGPSDTWAIVVHGKGGTLEESLRVVPILHELGYPILVISYRNDLGEARDPSGYYTWGQTDWVDVASAVRYANEQGAIEHILVGYSYGGAVITSYLTQSPLRNFTKAVILDAPVFSLEDTIDFRASQTEIPVVGVTLPNELTYFAKWIAGWRFDIDWDATDYLTQTSNLHAPMLVFHGTRDISVPYATSEAMAANRPDITTLITTEAGHTRSWNLDPDLYEETITEWLAGVD